MSSSKVICVGEALIDRLGACGSDFKYKNLSEDYLGGAPANVACGLSKLGIDVAFVGCLGNDIYGNRFKNLFISQNVNIDSLQFHSTLPTRVVLVSRDINGERSFGGFDGDLGNGFADQEIDLTLLKETWVSISNKANWLLIGTIPLASRSSKESLMWMLDNALELGIDIALDINWRPTFWNDQLSSNAPPNEFAFSLVNPILERVSLLKLAREEAIWFFNSPDPFEISKSLPQKPSVIVTDGASPVRWLLGDFCGQFQPFVPPQVIDTTGAGDSFLAGLISRLVFNGSLPGTFTTAEEMIRFSAACGALVCSGSGAIKPQPTSSEVIAFLASISGGII